MADSEHFRPNGYTWRATDLIQAIAGWQVCLFGPNEGDVEWHPIVGWIEEEQHGWFGGPIDYEDQEGKRYRAGIVPPDFPGNVWPAEDIADGRGWSVGPTLGPGWPVPPDDHLEEDRALCARYMEEDRVSRRAATLVIEAEDLLRGDEGAKGE